MPVGSFPRVLKNHESLFQSRSSIMKGLISGFALLTFLAASTLPFESYAQTSTGGTTSVAPETGAATPSTTKKSTKSSKSHAKKKSKKSPASQTSSAKQQHHTMNHTMNTGKHSRHSLS
jgi:hypothetical protein